MTNPTKPTANLTREELERQVRDFYPPEEVDLRLLFEDAKRNAVALFKEDHGDGDTAIYQFISDAIPLINTYTQAKERKAVLDARLSEQQIVRTNWNDSTDEEFADAMNERVEYIKKLKSELLSEKENL